MRGLPDGTHVDQRTGQECANRVDVNGEATLDLAIDHAHHHFVGHVRCLKAFPGFCALGFLTGKLGLSETVLDGLQRHLYFITHAETALTVGIGKLIQGNDPF